MYNKIHQRIKKWQKKYNTPNGWPVSQLIGTEYVQDAQVQRRRKK